MKGSKSGINLKVGKINHNSANDYCPISLSSFLLKRKSNTELISFTRKRKIPTPSLLDGINLEFPKEVKYLSDIIDSKLFWKRNAQRRLLGKNGV